jgi:hypothetical protein
LKKSAMSACWTSSQKSQDIDDFGKFGRLFDESGLTKIAKSFRLMCIKINVATTFRRFFRGQMSWFLKCCRQKVWQNNWRFFAQPTAVFAKIWL